MKCNHAKQRACGLRLLSPLVLAMATSACATIVEGTTQSVAFNSSPQGATCELGRTGIMLAEFITPAVATISKGTHPLNVTCRKDGYAPIAGSIPSDLNGWILGNAIIGGLTGVGIDLVTSADQSYPPLVTIALHTEPTPPARSMSERVESLAITQ